MRVRKIIKGTRNITGKRIKEEREKQHMKQKELLAKLQLHGLNINAATLSKIEGKLRLVTDVELSVFSNVLNVPMESLLEKKL